MNSKKLVFIDLDGTLLNDQKTISEFSLSVIQQLNQHPDYILCIASGRPYVMVKYYLHLMHITTPVITNNAANIKLASTGEILFQKCLPLTETLNYIQYCNLHHLNWAIFYTDHIYSTNTPERIARYSEYNSKLVSAGFPELPHTIISNDEDPVSLLTGGAERLSMLIQKEYEHELITSYFKEHSELHGIRSTPDSYDIVHPDVDKWQGVKFISNYYNIPLDQIYVFGNDRNDQQMMQNCPHSFAVSTSESSILSLANSVIDSNNEDGVAKAILKYLL